MLLDLTHTSHTRARTGVQRVARSLRTALGDRARPICHDPYLGAWRELEAWELANLAATAPAEKRGAQWPMRARLRGYARKLSGRITRRGPARRREEGLFAANGPAADGFIVPEIFSPEVGAALGGLLSQIQGLRIVIFHDAIALKYPELTPAKTVARFPAYLRELLAFDGIAATSEDSRQSLVDYWRWLGVASTPPVAAIPLGIDLAEVGRIIPNPPGTRANVDGANGGLGITRPTLLCVSSIEGRKNHVALLDACEQLWAGGARFELHLIGLAQPQTGRAALEKIASLQNAGRPLRYDGPVDEAALAGAYRQCAFTVYPSLIEGFGLPVLESLAYGRPCVCSVRGALGEAARGGGCLPLENVDAPTLAGAIKSLLSDGTLVDRLGAEARGRKFRTWSEYAGELTGWMGTLARR